MYFLEFNISAFNLEQCRRKVLSFFALRDQFCMYFFLTCTFLTQQLKNVFFLFVEFHHEHFVTQKRIFVLMHFQIFNIQI